MTSAPPVVAWVISAARSSTSASFPSPGRRTPASQPRELSVASRSALRSAATTLWAPSILAACTAIRPSAPEAPRISTVSPGRRPARHSSASHAASPELPSAAATASSTPSATSSSELSGTNVRSALARDLGEVQVVDASGADLDDDLAAGSRWLHELCRLGYRADRRIRHGNRSKVLTPIYAGGKPAKVLPAGGHGVRRDILGREGRSPRGYQRPDGVGARVDSGPATGFSAEIDMLPTRRSRSRRCRLESRNLTRRPQRTGLAFVALLTGPGSVLRPGRRAHGCRPRPGHYRIRSDRR